MTSTQWKRVRTLFESALDRPPDRRTTYLDDACNGDEALRREVEGLLHADEAAESFLEAPPQIDLGPEAGSGPFGATWKGRRVGAYRLTDRLGRGGMGAVYAAERADDQFQQRVAVKLIRWDADTTEGRRRFHVERQILANLQHPNIARLFDGGVTDEGVPYLVMEYVNGQPLTEYCRAHSPSVEERLELFRTVCDAVHYAHRNFVVHRDLKATNILVTDDGTVKLLDFGIAKLLAVGSDDQDANPFPVAVPPRTRTGMQLLTPECAAPEQIRGEAITTATDVYQLGVLLYELLTGRAPYRITTRVRHEIERAILEDTPERPSTAVTQTDEGTDGDGSPTPSATWTPDANGRVRLMNARQLRRRLAGDLDVICLKALKKDPERRYPDVDALADDVARHLSGRPVRARADTFTYRASRFVRRHRAAVAAAVLVGMAILMGSAAALWQSRVAAAERDRAEAALVQAEGTLSFLEDVIASGGPGEGSPDTPIGVVLDSAAARVDAELDGQPEVARAVHTSLAKVYFEMGRLSASEAAARSALALYGSERGNGYGRATQILAMALDYQDDHEAARTAFQTAIENLRGVPGNERLLASTLDTYAALLLELGREDEAQRALEESLALYRELGDTDILYPLSSLGVLHNHRGRFDEALPLLHEVVSILRARHDGPHYELGEALGNLAGTLNELGHRKEALATRREAVDMLVQTVGEEHHSAVISRAAYSNELRADGDLAAAEQAGQRALDASLRAFGSSHSLTAYAQNVAGQAFCAGSDPAVGAEMLRASLETRRAVLPAGNWLIANGESLLGACLGRLGEVPVEAERLLQSGYDGLRAVRGEAHKKTREARERLVAFEAARRPARPN